ncbi:MAG: RdgB/HAM1 family non-canonical purine NTP pyrophosphatase [Deltaproteobacteria bacterium]|nr:RdgB/HAM1 family non-canonical purine NTP pyrophosphatase [Deltaproteobacteria bacterium]
MKAGRRVVLASNNAGKLAELRRILAPLGFDLVSPRDLGFDIAPVEDGGDFDANALIKARYWIYATGLPAIADDSGLCVNALGGAPGVDSAIFAGPNATDAENNALLLERLRDIPETARDAHYHCTAACVAPDGRTLIAHGRADGLVLSAPHGDGGFGYDPVMLEPASGKTFAELDGGEKDAVSHRGKAFRALARQLAEFLTGESTA